MSFLINRQRITSLFVLLCVLLAIKPVQAMDSTYAAFQTFQNGYMIWREDTGEILALVQSTHQVYRFDEASYASLPENPVTETPPLELVNPIRGFGRVWGNFSTIRTLLGWGTTSEMGYTAVLHPLATATGGLAVTLPDGVTVHIYANNTWQPAPAPTDPSPHPPDSTQPYVAAFQAFERGYMLYQNGTIFVFKNNGQWQRFYSADYGLLSENPIQVNAPAGYIKPILGFGKVWGHFSQVRAALGWATTYEQSYLAHIGGEYPYPLTTLHPPVYTYPPGYFVLSFPDGRWVIVHHHSRIWNFL